MRRPLLFLLAAALPLLLYARTAGFDFVQADDADLIAGNEAFLSARSSWFAASGCVHRSARAQPR